MWDVARSTFAVGGPGAIIIQLTFIAVVSWLSSMITNAIGKSQISSIIQGVSNLICIGLAGKVLYDALVSINKVIMGGF